MNKGLMAILLSVGIHSFGQDNSVYIQIEQPSSWETSTLITSEAVVPKKAIYYLKDFRENSYKF